MVYTRWLCWLMLALYTGGALTALGFWRRPQLANWVANCCSSLAALAGIAAASSLLLSGFAKVSVLTIKSAIPFLAIILSLDRLAAFFLLALSILTLAVSIYSLGYLRHYYQECNLGVFNFLYNSFILAMIAVITANHLIGFLIAWELMSILSYFLVIYESDSAENLRAGRIYLIMTHLATALITIAFILIYHHSGSLLVSANLHNLAPYLKNILFGCLLIGFGTKAGVVPLHIWLPYAHPAAPSNISALMSGMMIKTAIYGLVRFVFGALGAEYEWWGITVLIIGMLSTVLGVAYALMEANIKRLLAYSSIENIGIILIGLGVAMTAAATGAKLLSSLALLAALLHLFNHSIFKGALFLGAGAVHYATGTKDLENLGGLLRRLPYTGAYFLIATLAIVALPPFNGFMSEWLIYQALFAKLLMAEVGGRIIALLAFSALGLAGALVAACFVKFYGIAFLGVPRTPAAANAVEVPRPMLWGMGLLALLCLVFGIWPSLIIQSISRVVADFTGVAIAPTLTGNTYLIYRPLMLAQSALSQFWLVVLGVALCCLVVIAQRMLAGRSKTRRYTTWDCGYRGLNSRQQYSAAGFSKPLRIIFRGLYRPSRELQVEEGPSPYIHKSLRYVMAYESIFEKYLYHPLINKFTTLARQVRLRVQTGSVHRYLMYMLLAILALFLYYILN